MPNKKTNRNRTKARKQRQRRASAPKPTPRTIGIAHGRSGLAILAALAMRGKL